MLRMIDLMRILCQWHERQYLAFKVGSDTPRVGEKQPGAGDTDASAPRNARTMTRADVQADMGTMMRNFNVDLNVLPHYREELLDAEQVCATCETVGRCYRWKHQGGRGDAPELFCPNVNLFSELESEPFWAKAELYDWPDDPAALPWLRTLGAGPKEVTDNPPDLGSDKLKAFAKAAVRIDRVVREWAPRIKKAESPDDAETLRQEADLAMAVAVEETDGMMLDDFRTIYHVAFHDATIAGEIKNLLEQATTG